MNNNGDVRMDAQAWKRSLPATIEALEPRVLLSVSTDTGPALLPVSQPRIPSPGLIVSPAATGATGEIRGGLWNDADASGLWDQGEGALVDWKVYIDADDDAAWDADEPYQMSDADGSYAFTGLDAGTYSIRADAPDGWAQTSLDSGRPISEFDIDVIFNDESLTPAQQAVFSAAAQRWQEIIIGDLPDAMTSLGLVDDVAIQASAPSIDGPGNILGMAGPIQFRSGSYLPVLGVMMFDSADLGTLEATGKFVDVIIHEMGHVLGIGTIWDDLGLLTSEGSNDPRFIGTSATAEYAALTGAPETSVPVANTGGSGTVGSHWRESVFNNELMTGYLDFGMTNPISRVTVGSLADLGYQVVPDAAEPYALPAGLQAASETAALAGWTVALDITPTFVETVAPSMSAATDVHVGDHHVVELVDGEVQAGIDFGYQEQPVTSTAPGVPDLLADSDTGAGDNDDLTRRDNSDAETTLRFEVPGTRAGGTVTLYADGQAIGTATGADGATIVETSGQFELADGARHITARQRAPGELESADSATLTVTVDTAAPSVSAFGLSSTHGDWLLGTIDSSQWTGGREHSTAPWSTVNLLVVSFAEAVVAAAGDMTVQGQTSGAIDVTDVSGGGSARVTWTVSGTAGGFLDRDRYAVAASSGVTDMAGNALAGGWNVALAVLPGDIDGDGEVGSLDRRDLRNGYGAEYGSTSYSPLVDVNGDGSIGSLDRLVVRNHYAESLPAAPQNLTQPLVQSAAPKPATPSVLTLRPSRLSRIRYIRMIRYCFRAIKYSSNARTASYASQLIHRLLTLLTVRWR